MGVELWLMRHGETEWTVSGAHTSRTDIPLTDQGRLRAAKLRDYLTGVKFAKVFASPMGRAQETCRIAGLGDQMQIDPNLMEFDYGVAEGKTTKEMQKELNDPDWGVWNRPQVGGETLDRVGERADLAIARALDGTPDHSKVALFAHGHILRILAARWAGMPAVGGQHLGLGTGSVSVLGWEHEARIIVHWNRCFDD
jgi:broad specificity phosphatase PhoE